MKSALPLFCLRWLPYVYCFTVLVTSSAYASDYGCKVLLCLATPGNPKQHAECVPPINQLFHDLARGRAFPTCGLADGHDGSSYAKQVNDPYDPCPAGTLPANATSYIVQGSIAPKQSRWQSAYTITGTPTVSQPDNTDERGIGSRACVSNPIGQYLGGYDDNRYPVYVYQTVIWQPPQNPRAIDVYIDNQLYKRVRW